MSTLNIHQIKQWAKTSDHLLARLIKQTWVSIKQFEIPSIPILFSVLYFMHVFIKQLVSDVLRILYYTPIFKARVSNCPKQLYLYGGLPVVIGSLNIIIGDKVRLAAMTTLSGRTVHGSKPLLKLGHNVGIGWRTAIAVGNKVIIGDNVRVAGDCFLAGYPGHPVNAKQRALGMPDTDDQVGDIILEDDVWLGTGVKVLPGVTIGQGTIVASGSVVTKSLPKNILAAGVPAKKIKDLGV